VEIKGFKNIIITVGISFTIGAIACLFIVYLGTRGLASDYNESRDRAKLLEGTVEAFARGFRETNDIITKQRENDRQLKQRYSELESAYIRLGIDRNNLRNDYSTIKSRSEELERINRELTESGGFIIEYGGNAEASSERLTDLLRGAREILEDTNSQETD
jgi:chromosome segregation ATPase